MAKTPFIDLKSEDILSAHVSGIQHAVNKLEEALNMKTATKTNHPLVAVTDQEDATLHNFIYEGTIRNWLTSPLIVIKRNGVTVDPSEYELQAPYGAVVFKNQQNASDAITANFTHVINQAQAFTDVDTKIAKLVIPSGLQMPGTYMTHAIGGIKPATLATAVDAGSKNLDFFPFFVSNPMTFDQMMIMYAKNTGGTYTRMGIYSSNVDLPYQLLAETGKVMNPGTDPVAPGFTMVTGTFSTDLVLQPGLYYIARWQDSGISYNGLNWNQAVNLGNAFGTVSNASQFGGYREYGFGGFRVTADYPNGLPATAPAIGSAASDLRYLERDNFASPWVRRKA